MDVSVWGGVIRWWVGRTRYVGTNMSKVPLYLGGKYLVS